ncbi:hypothetical protein CHUAL_001119 [Chamberlinius hualienensis]
MKLTCLSLSFILTIVIIKVQSDPCLGPTDQLSCPISECCAKHVLIHSKYMCKEKGRSVGDRCGGKFSCGCSWGLTCQDDESGFWNRFKVGTGTCQRQRSLS